MMSESAATSIDGDFLLEILDYDSESVVGYGARFEAAHQLRRRREFYIQKMGF